jgi:RNA polymerase sigma-70 factor (TIGR02943 family)
VSEESATTLEPTTWVARYSRELFRYAVQRLRNEDDSEDVVQETFLTAWRTRENFRGDLSERNWLYMILKSRIIDLVRKRQTRQKNFADVENVGEDTFAADGHWSAEQRANQWPPDAMDHLERVEFQEIFNSCLDDLNDRQRLIFMAKEIDGLEADEICQEFDITTSNLWVILHRARLKLRGCLEKKWFDSSRETTS